MTSTSSLARFNAASEADARALLVPCADVPAWVAQIVAGRPYDDRATVLSRAEALSRRWTPDDVRRALAQHPRIGDRHAREGTTEAHLSADEQSGVAGEQRARLARGNQEYEDRFGHVFLIRAKGRTGADILEALEKRLGNDPVTELDETTQQLREIALLRLEAAFEDESAR